MFLGRVVAIALFSASCTTALAFPILQHWAKQQDDDAVMAPPASRVTPVAAPRPLRFMPRSLGTFCALRRDVCRTFVDASEEAARVETPEKEEDDEEGAKGKKTKKKPITPLVLSIMRLNHAF